MIEAAIVGLGRWGRGLVESVQGKSGRIRFTRAVTRTPARAEGFCAAHGLVPGDDYDDVLGDRAIDAVVLATPHTLHADEIGAAAVAGKHVFCEKPFTLSRKDAERALAACADAKVAVGVGHNRRFMANARALKAMIENGALGTLLHVEGNFSADLSTAAGRWRDSRAESPAGGMTSLGIHALDMMIHLCGPVVDVEARSLRRALPLDIDDTTAVLLGFASGMTGYLGTMAAGGRLWHVRVFGARAWAELRGPDALVSCGPDGREAVTAFPAGAYPHDDSIAAELEAFAAACEGGPPFPITPDEILNGVAALEAIVRSVSCNGGRVKVG